MTQNIQELFDKAKAKPSFDPTGTTQLRAKFRAAGNLNLHRLRQQLRQAVVEFNILGLDGSERNSFRSSADNLQQFAGWLETAASAALAAKWWTHPYLDQAIVSGITKATTELGYRKTVPPIHPAFGGVYQSAHHELKGITAALVQKVTRQAARSQTRRDTPAKAFFDLVRPLDGDIANRLGAFTHTFTVKGHNKGKIETYRANGINLVGILPETTQRFKADSAIADDVSGGLVGWLTAGDDDVCIVCQDGADDSPYTLDEADDLIPAHPNCRCAVYPWHDLRFGGDSLLCGTAFYLSLPKVCVTADVQSRPQGGLRRLEKRRRSALGDTGEEPGHPFRGNQYTTGESGGGSNGGSASTERGGSSPVKPAASGGPGAGGAHPVALSEPRRGGPDSGAESSRGDLALHEMIGGAHEFHAALSSAKQANPYGAAVELHPVEDYQHDRLWLTGSGKAGFALQGDNIVSVFKHPDAGIPNFAQSALHVAVANGGRRLDAFDTALPFIYSKAGFRAVARTAFNDNYKPEGWDHSQYAEYNGGRPDVVFMIYDPSHTKPYQPGDGKLVASYDEGEALQKAEVARLAAPNPPTHSKFVKEGGGSGDGKYTNASGESVWINTMPLKTSERLQLKRDMGEFAKHLDSALGDTGDEPGHPFRGNQYTAGESGGGSEPDADPERVNGIKLSDPEQNALGHYSAQSWLPISEHLRGGKTLPKSLKEELGHIDSAFAKASLPMDLQVGRWIDTSVLKKYEALNGKVVTDHGFASASMNAEALDDSITQNRELVTIDLPKGSKALVMGTMANSPQEGEVLINRGSKFKVQVKKDGVYLTLVK